MITDEGQMSAARVMREASENNLRAANLIHDAVNAITPLIGQGYGSTLEELVAQLKRFNDARRT